MALVASFAPSLRSGANDATRATNKQYALQKSSYCPIHQAVFENESDIFIKSKEISNPCNIKKSVLEA